MANKVQVTKASIHLLLYKYTNTKTNKKSLLTQRLLSHFKKIGSICVLWMPPKKFNNKKIQKIHDVYIICLNLVCGEDPNVSVPWKFVLV